ncbi:MAG TPA: hypothetical protein V6C72_03595 [Chroococcales cyanobacterium]
MTECFSIYSIDEEELPTDLSGSDEEIYNALVEAIEKQGNLLSTVEMTEDDFIDALDSIDEHIGGTRLLQNCAFNNSPFDILGRNGDCPYFGYFNPAQTQEVFALLEGLTADVRDTIDSVYTHAEVFEAFFASSEEAVEINGALAIIHS